MRLMLVDDETLARQRLRQLIDDIARAQPELALQVVAEAGDATQAQTLLRRTAVDVLLLDIGMPGRSAHEGLRLAQELRSLPQPPALVFVTAHAEHALQAFELQALDYLTKPVRQQRLLQTLLLLRARGVGLTARPGAAGMLKPGPGAAPGDSTAPADAGRTPALVIDERGRTLRLPLHELLSLQAEQKQVLIRSAHASHRVDESLSELEQRLQDADVRGAAPRFVRVHRNALVAVAAIRELAMHEWPAADPATGSAPGSVSARELASEPAGSESWAVRVAPLDEWLAVSRRQVSSVREALLARAG